jgi:hypothetical protein
MKRKALILLATLAAMALGTLSILSVRNAATEQWYIRKLRNGDSETVRNVAEQLGEVGQEAAYLALRDRLFELLPGLLFVRTAAQPARPLSWYDVWKPAPLGFSKVEELNSVQGALKKIRSRIGLRRLRPLMIKSLSDPSVSLRQRINFACGPATLLSKRADAELLISSEWREAKNQKTLTMS